jgi:hypothetical protein
MKTLRQRPFKRKWKHLKDKTYNFLFEIWPRVTEGLKAKTDRLAD